MKSSRSIIRIVLVAMSVLMLSACNQPVATPTPVPTKAVTATPAATVPAAATQPTAGGPTLPPPPKVGEVAPDFTLTSVDGQEVTLSSFWGKPVMLVFFATWCPHCKAETELVLKHYDEITAAGFTVIGVSLGETADKVVAFQQELKVPWALLLDSDGAVARRYYVRSIPLSIFLTDQGRIKSGYLGEIEESVLLEELKAGA